jgi:hypothetical protein
VFLALYLSAIVFTETRKSDMSTDNSDANDQIRFIDYSYINFVHPTISTDPGGNVVPVDLKYTQAADTKSLESFQADQTYNNVACGRLLETPNAIKLPQAVQHVDTASLYSQTMHPISSALYDVGMLMLPNTAPLQTPSSYGLEYPTNCYQEEEALRPEARPVNKQYLIDNTVVQDDMIRLSPIKFCSNCFTTETPSWRRCSEGKMLLCNACGL